MKNYLLKISNTGNEVLGLQLALAERGFNPGRKMVFSGKQRLPP